MRRFLIILTLVVGSVSSVSGFYTTVLDGAFEDPHIWDCACVPATIDNVVIENIVTTSLAHTVDGLKIAAGGMLTSSANFVVKGTLRIDAGGEMKNLAPMFVKFHYVLNGIHSGMATTTFTGSADMFGSGTYSNKIMPVFNAGVRTVLVGSDLEFATNTVRMKNNAIINNYGKFRVRFLWGGGNEEWYNRSGSTLTVSSKIKSGMKLYAHYTGNTIEYIKSGATTQDLKVPVLGYYNVLLKGNSLATIKRSVNDFEVLNELRIETCTFDAARGAVVSDFTIQGDWNNVSGKFKPRTGRVIFSAASTVNSHESMEEFYDIEFSGSTQLLTDILVTSEVFVSSTLDANGNNIHVTGDWICVGDYVGNDGAVFFQGTDPSNVSGVTDFDDVHIDKSAGGVISTGTMNIYETLWMDNGVITTNDNLVIASNSSRTGRLGEMGSGTFIGDIIVERYTQFTSNGWHLLGSSVQDMTIGEWNDDILTTGFVGSDYPTNWFCSITKYDETVLGERDQGIEGVNSVSDVVPEGEGRRTYMAPGVNILSVKGAPIIGPFSWSVTYSDSGSPIDDGWNLISNPYPSTIDWDDTGNWTRSGVKDAIYVWVSEDEQYSSYIAGVGTNGGSQYIPSSQAFWVQTDFDFPMLSTVEAVKIDEDQVFKSNDAMSFFKIQMTTSNGRTDEVAVRLDENATYDFDSALDAYEWRSTNTSYPSIGLLTEDGKSSSIYSFPSLEEEIVIPFALYVGSGGSVAFKALGLSNMIQAQNLRIYDAENSEYHQLRDKEAITLDLEIGEYSDRFYLSITPRTAYNAVKSLTQVESDYKVWMQGDKINIQGNGNASGSVSIDIYNSAGQLLLSEKAITLSGIYREELPEFKGLLIVELNDLISGTKTVERIAR